MRLVSFRRDGTRVHAGIATEHGIIDVHEGLALVNDERPATPASLSDIIRGTHDTVHLGAVSVIQEVVEQLQTSSDISYWFGGVEMLMRRNDVQLLAPLADIPYWRRCALYLPSYETIFKQRGDVLPMHWYEHIPIWAGFAPQLYGDRSVLPFPDTTACDVECEVVWVVGRDVRNCDPEDGLDAILGLSLLCSVVDATRASEDVLHGQWSRPLGVVMGPALTCVDELVEFMLPDGRFRIEVRLLVNDVPVAQINLRDVHYTMGSAIAHASDGQEVQAASVFSSGVLCSLGIAGAPWLVPGDVVELDAGPLGALRWTMEG